MVTTNDRQFADLARRLCNHAFHPEQHFWHEYVGFNYRKTNLQAAVGLAQTERFDEIVRVKKKRSELFQQWSAVAPGATLELEFEAAAVTGRAPGRG